MIPTPTRTAKSVARKANMRAIRGASRASKVTPAGDKPVSTYPLNRHNDPQITAVLNVDCFEAGGIIRWDRSMRRQELADALAEARRERKSVRIKIAGYRVRLDHKGIDRCHYSGKGRGRDSYMEYCIKWRGVTVGLSARRSKNRKLYNYKLIASGQPCTVVGLPVILEFCKRIISSLGGTLVDSWPKRLDLCLDGMTDKPLMPVLLNSMKHGCYITSSRQDIVYYPTSFLIFSDNIRLNIYDKIAEMRDNKHNAAYHKAMRQRLCMGGPMPRHVVRVEFRLCKLWLYKLGMHNVDELLSGLGEVVYHLTADRPRPFFRLTTEPPDKKNRHTSRAKTDHVWAQLCAAMQEGVPDVLSPPAPTKKRKPRP